MTHKQEKELNHFFVSTFNKILLWEERALNQSGITNLSVKELHILEATAQLTAFGQNTMSNVARQNDITVGALTTAVNTLVKKGYLTRGNDVNDRRIVTIELTDLGLEAERKHAKYHEDMVNDVAKVLDEAELDTLTHSLQQLSDYFQSAMKE